MVSKAHMLRHFRARFIRLEHLCFYFFNYFVYRVRVKAL
ncbi:hypothetical protein CKA32_007126 [Geitlerinema sp. FC II]|nr:hypothetical protein CKA32_007126 [Geitlerinema sp. FC II]